jgi:hypothetical protein
MRYAVSNGKEDLASSRVEETFFILQKFLLCKNFCKIKIKSTMLPQANLASIGTDVAFEQPSRKLCQITVNP